MTALQDWLNIRPIDPRHHVKAVICALRGLSTDDAADVVVDPPLMQRGVERC
jgi:hypothetical protein